MSENSSENSETEAETSGQTEKDKSLKNTWKDRTKNLPLKYKIGAAGAALAAFAAGAIGINKATEGNNQSDTIVRPTPEETLKPTVEPTQVAEITPTPIERTQTPSPTETSTPAPQTETPAPTETQKPKNYEILDKGILNPEHPAYESIKLEDAVKTIDNFFEKYPALTHPQYGNLKIEVILGGGNWYFPNEHRLVADRASANFEEKFTHEVVHSWDNVLKSQGEFLQSREAVLSDPQIGRHYPDIETLMSTQYIPVLAKFMDGNSTLTLDELQDLASNQADIFWLHSDELDPLSSYFTEQSLTSKTGTYESLAQFLEDPDVKAVTERNKYWNFIYQVIKSDPKWADYVLKIHPQLYSQTDAQTYTKAFTSTGRLILSEKLLATDPQVPDLFSQDQIQHITSELEKRKNKTDDEMFAEIISKWIYLSERNRIEGEDTNLNYLINLVKNSQIN